MPLLSLLSCRAVDGYWSPGIRACAYPVGTLMGPCRHPELTRKCPGTWVGLRIDPGVRNAPHSRWYRIRGTTSGDRALRIGAATRCRPPKSSRALSPVDRPGMVAPIVRRDVRPALGIQSRVSVPDLDNHRCRPGIQPAFQSPP